MSAIPAITVYSTGPSCQPCKAVYRWLDKHGFKGCYDIVITPENPKIAAELKAQGFLQSPVVEINGFRFGGFDTDELLRLLGEHPSYVK